MLHISRIFLYCPIRIVKAKNNNYKLRASLKFILFPHILMFTTGVLGVMEIIEMTKIRDDSRVKSLFTPQSRDMNISGPGLWFKLREVHHVINIHKGFTTRIIISLSKYGFAHCIYLLGIVSAPFTFKHFWSFLDHIKKVDLAMKKRESIKNRNCNSLICITIILFWFPSILDNFIHLIGRSLKFDHLIHLFLEVRLQVVYIYLVLLQLNYVSLTYLICVRLNKMNNYLSEILMDERKVHSFGNTFSRNISFIKCRNQEGFTSENEVMYSKVCTLIHMQRELLKATEEINNLYSFYSMIMVASSFVNLLSASYNLIYHCNLWDLLHLPVDALRIVYEIYCLVLVTEIPHRCKKYVNTATTKILEIISVESDPETRNELKILLVGFLHCPTDFSVNGFIKLERNLILKVIGTVAIYLLVLHMK